MFRNVFRLILIFVGTLFLRQVVLMVMRMFAQLGGGGSASAPPRAPREQLGGELKKDPVCGTFVAVASSIKRTVNGETLHFCSTACRDKYLVA